MKIARAIRADAAKFAVSDPLHITQTAAFCRAPLLAGCLLMTPFVGRAASPFFFRDKLMPPPEGMYVSTGQWFAAYANGVVIRNTAQRLPTQSVLPPSTRPGEHVIHTFSWQMEMEVSADGGTTFAPVTAGADTTIRLEFAYMSGPEEVYGGETLSLTLQPAPWLLLRESPTLTSAGQTRIRPVTGGYMIDSFFDIFTEISTDGGASWWPALQASHVSVKPDPALIPTVVSPRSVTPMPNGHYTSPQPHWQSYASGVRLRDVSHRLFSQWQELPPAGAPQAQTFDAQFDFQLSLDGGLSWQVGRAPSVMSFTIANVREFAGTTSYEAEATQLDVAGGDLPSGVMIRESPTRPSQGGATLKSAGGGGGGYHVSSFFDIFTEISTDGGATWSPSTDAPARMALSRVAAAHAFESVLQPTPCGRYVSNPPWFSYYASGIVISNFVSRTFSDSYPPPKPGETASHTFDSQVEMQLSYDGGVTYHHVFAPAAHWVQTTGRLGGDGFTETYDTEMLQMNVSGGGLPGGMQIRESPTRASLGRTTATGLTGGGYQIDSFFDIYTEVSTDGGMTWLPAAGGPSTVILLPPEPLEITCPSDVTVRALTRAGAVVTYPAPTVSGGCPPVTVISTPPSGSFFPLGVTVVSCLASDICANVDICSFTITVLRPLRKHVFEQTLLPPPSGMYVPPEPQTILYANGMLMRNPAHRLFAASVAPPTAPGASLTHTFGSQVELEVSMDGGVTWWPFTADASTSVRITNNGPDGGDTLYEAEMLDLSVSGGTLPPGVMIRESPILASLGETRIEAIGGGHMIDSFFDIFTEVSIDGGATWSPALQPCSMELKQDPAQIAPVATPRSVEPMPNGLYASRPGGRAEYASGIQLRKLRNKLFTQWQALPPPDALNAHTCDAQLDLQLSTDGGATWSPVRTPGTMACTSRNVRQFAGQSTFETTLTQLDFAGGDLPAGVMIRESPTRVSEGGLALVASGGGYDVSSFFDIFTEVSTDGGASWSPATNGAVRLELERVAPSHAYASDLQPPPASRYVHTQPWFAGYASGIILSNVVARRHTASCAPPAPGVTTTHMFGSQVEMEVSLDSGSTWSHASAAATLSMQITGRLGGDGVTEYYDTEMTQLSISGGSLPGFVQIRESPTRASSGRTTASGASGGPYQIDSFFDIYTEVSTDGGMTWFPTVIGPATQTLEPDPPLTITCPSDISVLATNWNGRAVLYPPPATGGGVPPVTVTCLPPSGSFFPIGATRVICTASDWAGQTSECAFVVNVVSQPEIDGFPDSVARLTVQHVAGGSETVSLVGPSRMEVYVGALGECEDSDGDGRDDATADLAELALRGYSTLLGSSVCLRKAARERSPGQHEEQVNAAPGLLDVRPFCPAGTCDSFFDVFLEVDVGGQVLRPASPIRIQAVIHYKPPLPGETYVASLQSPVPLLDAQGQPTAFMLAGLEYMPATTAEIDTFAPIDTTVTLRLPSSGRIESVRLTGTAKAHVYFEGGEGQATDNDCDGLDEVVQSLLSLDLSGVCSEGPISVTLAPDPVSLGQIEERANSMIGLLDVPPFQPTGDCDSFFDVFYLWAIGSTTLHTVVPWRLSAVITHKPPAAGELFASAVETSVDLYDEWGALTLGRLNRQWLALTPPELDIDPGTASTMRLAWPNPSTGYLLECCSNLVPPILWQVVPVTPIIGPDGRKTVVVGGSGSNVFFKLSHPLP